MEIVDKIYRIWSAKQEQQIAVRICYTVEETSTSRVLNVTGREEWS